jgi:hypothetical protein
MPRLGLRPRLGMPRLGLRSRLGMRPRLTAVVTAGETAVVVARVAGAAGLSLEIFLFLYEPLKGIVNVRQLHDRPFGGKGHPRGYQKRRQQRHRAECFFH